MANSSDGTFEYRPTLWPGVTVPVPKLRPLRDVTVVMADEFEGWITWPEQDVEDSAPLVDLPPDFYLQELLELPVWTGSRQALLERCGEFMRAYGLLLPVDGSCWDTAVDGPRPLRVGSVGSTRLDRYSLDGDLVLREMRVANTAAETWRAVQTGDFSEVDEAIEQLDEDRDHDFWSFRTRRNALPSRGDLHALRLHWIDVMLGDSLNDALKAFSIGIGAYEARSPCIYTASFLQIYNHMVEDAKIKQCAKEGCGKAFVRQRGRSRFDQHRTEGVKYCSRECAQAQSQRELRRRRKAAGR